MDPLEKKFYITFLITALSLLIIFLYLGWRLVRQKQLHEIEKNKHYLQEVEVLENERKRFSMDLHDELGPALTISEKMITAVKGADETDKQLLVKSREYLEKMNKRIREISQNMHAHILVEKGLKLALTELLEQTKLVANLSFSFEYNVKRRFPHQVKTHLFRMFQEMVANSVKHGKANFISIKMEETTDAIMMSFRDNGIGFKIEESNGKGIGLSNLKHRVAILNGEVMIKSNLAKGTTFYINIPINHREWNQ